jgi:hypothetical protein
VLQNNITNKIHTPEEELFEISLIPKTTKGSSYRKEKLNTKAGTEIQTLDTGIMNNARDKLHAQGFKGMDS